MFNLKSEKCITPHILTPRQQVLFFPVIDRKIFEIKFLLVE